MIYVVRHLPACLKLPTPKRSQFIQMFNASLARHIKTQTALLIFVISDAKERNMTFLKRMFTV